MKGPFGVLLIGGGVILLVGLFSGKITFGQPAATTNATPVAQGPATQGAVAGAVGVAGTQSSILQGILAGLGL